MLRQLIPTMGKVALFWVLTMVVLAFCDAIAGHSRNAMLVIGAITALATFGLTWIFVRWQRESLADFGFGITRATWLRLLIGLCFGAFLIMAQTAVMWLAGGVRWVANTPEPAMIFTALGYLLLATREELAFRGYPLRLLASRTHNWLALMIVASLFVIEHKLGGASWPDAVIGPGLGAILFGLAALATRGLAFPIGLHAAWNIGDWMRGGKGDGGLWHLVVQPGSVSHANQVAWASYAGVMLLAIAILILWRRRYRPSAR